MSSKEKLIKRFLALPTDFSWDGIRQLLSYLGYELCNKGRTSGSRVIFKQSGKRPIMLHKPHPGNIIKEYALKQVYESLKIDKLI